MSINIVRNIIFNIMKTPQGEYACQIYQLEFQYSKESIRCFFNYSNFRTIQIVWGIQILLNKFFLEWVITRYSVRSILTIE